MEAVAANVATNITYTFYVGNNTQSISASSSARCSAMKTHATYGNYFECICALAGYTMPPIVCGDESGKMCVYDKLPSA